MPQIKLDWLDQNSGSAEEGGFRIYRSSGPIYLSSLPAPIATLGAGATAYTDTMAPAGDVYYVVGTFIGSAERFTPQSFITIGGSFISSTKWRIMENAVVSGNTPSFAELEMMDLIGGATITVGGVASAQSVYAGATVQTADMAFDGDINTRWAAAAFDVPAWLEYEFPSAVSIREIAITARIDAQFNLSPKDFEVQYFDGSVWQTIFTKTGESAWSPGLRRAYVVQ